MDGTYITRVAAKQHLRVDFTDDDIYIDSLIALVEELVLVEIQGSIPGEGTIATTAAVAVVGTDTNFTDYTVGDVIVVKDETLGTITTKIIATITSDTALTVSVAFGGTASGLTYVVHPGIPGVSPAIPKGLKQAMLLMIGHFYMLREPVTIGVAVNKVPFAFEFLIAPYKHYTVA